MIEDTVGSVAVLVGPHATYRTMRLSSVRRLGSVETAVIECKNGYCQFHDGEAVPTRARNVLWSRVSYGRLINGVFYVFFALENMERPVNEGEIECVVSDIRNTRKEWGVEKTIEMLEHRTRAMMEHEEIVKRLAEGKR